MKRIIFVLIMFNAIAIHAHKPNLFQTSVEVVREATAELDQAVSSPEGSLYKFAQKYHISGEYTMQLTLQNKGQVVSVFVQDKKDGNIDSQNRLKDRLLDFQFSFKMPKNKDYKLSYTFKF